MQAKKSEQPLLDGFLPSSSTSRNHLGSSLLPSAGRQTRTTRKLRCIVLAAIFAKSASGQPVSLGAKNTSAVISTYMDSSHQVRLVLDVPLRGVSFTEGLEDLGSSPPRGLTR